MITPDLVELVNQLTRRTVAAEQELARVKEERQRFEWQAQSLDATVRRLRKELNAVKPGAGGECDKMVYPPTAFGCKSCLLPFGHDGQCRDSLEEAE